MNPADLPVPRVIGQTGVDHGWDQLLLDRIIARDNGALVDLRDRLDGPIFDRVRDLTGDWLVASLITCGVLTLVWRSPAAFAGHDLRTSLLSIAAFRARLWLATGSRGERPFGPPNELA